MTMTNKLCQFRTSWGRRSELCILDRRAAAGIAAAASPGERRMFGAREESKRRYGAENGSGEKEIADIKAGRHEPRLFVTVVRRICARIYIYT